MPVPKSNGSSPKNPSSPQAGDHGTENASSPTEQPAGTIEVDTDDVDSSYPESTRVSDTSSLRSSIMNYKWENGRRYHAYQDGSYWGPNDEVQQDAEDMMHEVHRIILDGKLCDVPFKGDIHNILDVGCGTGAWAIDFADENPSASVIGVDLSPIQPPFVPPNCRFEVDDVNVDWTWPENHFDFIHVRAMTGSIPNWVEFHKRALKHLKPGGWVEHVELSCFGKADDDSIKADSPIHTWEDIFKRLGSASGKTFYACEQAHDAVRDAGFANVRQRLVKVPCGTWPKDKELKQWGAWNRQFCIQGLEGFSIRGLTDLLGWSYEEAQVYLARMRKELTDPNVHSYLNLCIVRGQRPEDENPQDGLDK